jgi:hypothetical protein
MLVPTGGGGSPAMLPVGFRNLTRHSDTALWALWRGAQISIATQVDLNPLQRSFEDVPPEIRPGDARTMKVLPHQLLVAAGADVSSPLLFAQTGPSVLILLA